MRAAEVKSDAKCLLLLADASYTVLSAAQLVVLAEFRREKRRICLISVKAMRFPILLSSLSRRILDSHVSLAGVARSVMRANEVRNLLAGLILELYSIHFSRTSSLLPNEVTPEVQQS